MSREKELNCILLKTKYSFRPKMVKPDKKNKREYERKKKAEEPRNNPETERRRKQTDESRIRTDKQEKPGQASEPKPTGRLPRKIYDLKLSQC